MEHVQETINKIINNDLDDTELEQYLDSPLVLAKANAIIAVLKRNKTGGQIIHKLSRISLNIHHEPKVLGEWTTGHFAIAVLGLLNTKETQKICDHALKGLDESGRESVIRLMGELNTIDIKN